jgi:hypothetical protein
MLNDQEEQQHDETKTAAPTGWTGRERRRPGRVKFTNPYLIALLRRETPIGDISDAPDETVGRDDLGTAKGIMLAVALSAAIWDAVVLIVLMLRG